MTMKQTTKASYDSFVKLLKTETTCGITTDTRDNDDGTQTVSVYCDGRLEAQRISKPSSVPHLAKIGIEETVSCWVSDSSDWGRAAINA